MTIEIILESNKTYIGLLGTTKTPEERFNEAKSIEGGKIVVINPILDFDLEIFISWIKELNPEKVILKAFRRGKKKKFDTLEPSKTKTRELINQLGEFTQVDIDPSMSRILFPKKKLIRSGVCLYCGKELPERKVHFCSYECLKLQCDANKPKRKKREYKIGRDLVIPDRLLKPKKGKKSNEKKKMSGL